MNSERPHENTENDNILQTVTALKNSWIVCKSKSHIGRIYYFNTLTGEAAWNLSDSEIEKAKKRTKIFQSQTGSMLESCPEPIDPPSDNVPVCNRETAPLCYFHHPPCDTQGQNKKYSKRHFQITPFSSTHCVKCNLVNTVNTEEPSQTAFNPNIWSIPPNHQIVIAPTTPLINKTPTSLNVAYNNLEQHVSVQDTSLPLTRFNSFCNNKNIRNSRCGHGRIKYIPRKYFNANQRHNNYFNNNFNGPSTSNDLRQVLSAKKNNDWRNKQEKNNQDKLLLTASTSGSGQKIQIIKPAENLYRSNADDHWLKEHAHVEGTQLKLNVKPLKDIVMQDADKSCWYIVADSNTLFNHFNFINIVVNSDEQCQLMVPFNTMAELQMISRSEDTQLMSSAHIVLRHLSQLFTTGCAVIGKDSSKDSESANIVDFTIKLAEQNHNVVIVSNNNETRKRDDNIHIFTTEQIKEIITSAPVTHKCIPQVSSKAIRTIPYDSTTSFGTQTSEEIRINPSIDQTKLVNNVKNNLKNMGVQTEIENVAETFCKKTYTDSISDNHIDSLSNQFKQSNNIGNSDCMISKNVNSAPKRREIQLKRKTYLQSVNPNENNVEKRQFKWRTRRKKDILDQPMNCILPITGDVTNGIVDKTNPYPNFHEGITGENFYCDKINEENTSINKDHYDDNLSENTSGSSFMQKDITEKIVIEETSTSVISNTGSNVDSESLYNIKQNFSTNINNDNSDQGSHKCVMFEIENSLMENRLKTRSDEWLSRFVQIMEEILTQVLQLDPPFQHRSLPPPWTLHEATECIKKKFHTDCDITHAASKLTDLLYRNSDDRGKICIPLKPNVFMEMYSYGVYLVDSLQAVVVNCEDLQIAVDSLTKLLAEIQNPNNSSINNDSFIDEVDDPSANATVCSNSTGKTNNSTRNTNQDNTKLLINKSNEEIESGSDRRYSLRSNKRKSKEKVDELQDVTFVRNIDIKSTFFSCLKLQRNQSNSDSAHVEKSEKILMKNKPAQNDAIDDQHSTEPKIIRHFSKCLEYEERLKNYQRQEDLDTLDYIADDQDGYEHEEYEQEEYGYYDDEEYNYDINYTPNHNYTNEEMEVMSAMDIERTNYDKCSKDKNGNHDFKPIFGKFMNELQQTLKQVHSFCVYSRDRLSHSESLTPEKRLQIQEHAVRAQAHLDNLLKALNSITFRDDLGCGYDIQTILHKVGAIMDSSQTAEYRNIIAKVKDQATILLETVNIVLEAVK